MEETSSAAFNELVGRNVQRFRKARGLTQSELADDLAAYGLPFRQQTVLKVEKGSRPLKLEEAVRIAQVLKVEVGDLLLVDDDLAHAVEDLMEARLEASQWQAEVSRLSRELTEAQKQSKLALRFEVDFERNLEAMRRGEPLPPDTAKVHGSFAHWIGDRSHDRTEQYAEEGDDHGEH